MSRRLASTLAPLPTSPLPLAPLAILARSPLQRRGCPSRADVLAWVEASHGWFADAGVEPPLPLPSVDESMRHSLKGARTSVVRQKQRLDPSPTEAELSPAPTEGESVPSDDTESCQSWGENVKTNDLDE